jgi:hypothetical protein
MQREIIILVGPPESGKTTMAKLLTHDSATGLYFDVRQDGICAATPFAIKGMMLCPRVVICAFSSGAARTNENLKPLFEGARTIVVNVSRGDTTPLVPAVALSSPARFREWLLSYGNHTFTGGQKELNKIIETLPPDSSLADLQKLKLPCLKMADAH